MLEYTHSDFNIYIGQNKEENHWLVMNMNLEDYWLHISDYSSAHAIIKNPLNIKIPIKILKYVCCIMKANSNKCKSMKKLSFDISQIKYLEPTNNKGEVIVNKLIKNIII